MRTPLAVAASLATLAFAFAGPALAGTHAPQSAGSASDTAAAAAVHAARASGGRWHCTPAGCAGAPSSAWGNGAGFAAATLAAVAIARGRPSRPA
jgi:hypothetical protein